MLSFFSTYTLVNVVFPLGRERREAYRIILLFGVISLLGDIIYEGARGIIAPYMRSLGASPEIVGLVTGIADILSYGVRLPAGIYADITGRYWGFTFAGYGLLISIPLMALGGTWVLIAILYLFERMGKGLRSPARDVLLSVPSTKVGTAKGFALHEVLDQVGAVLGPLILASILYLTLSYSMSFASLAIPYALLMGTLVITRGIYVKTIRITIKKNVRHGFQALNLRPLGKNFILYMMAIAFWGLGFISYEIFSYFVKDYIPDYEILILYSIAMLVDALGAVLISFTYEKWGFLTLITLPIVSSILPFTATIGLRLYVYLTAGLIGIVIGITETIVRASIADMIPIEYRGTAYGIFNITLGFSLLIGKVITAKIFKTYLLPYYVIILQTLSLIFIVITYIKLRK
ncbi:MAG TPA: MFS transporter [Acidilobales archaeon]|nr:MAG: MFS transporter [Desulfurococcales archaeon ex4484_42]HDD25795.1 MFS transporter [Acidilobales archaeon]